MKTALAALLLLSSMPVNAGAIGESIGDKSNREAYEEYESQRGYASQNTCFRREYREEYIPGTARNPGYVITHREKVEVPCDSWRATRYYDEAPAQPVYRRYPDADGNDCSGGTAAGAILGGGAAAALSRGDGRWWAIPLGVVTGAVVGCDMAGG
tara:strand:+ start:2251 stop:2715 length:465 start_codon:yes stop_codon:yes gene_type:complete